MEKEPPVPVGDWRDQIPDSCCRKIVPEVVRKNTCCLEITVLRNAVPSSLEGY
jgi:hypothetical protein